ncbi:hypothetical protein HOY80DRAFT_942460 [Tuber brumale]|nr:hypothetical protein HOY80DRAFT_942460 [Tuber brumale]
MCILQIFFFSFVITFHSSLQPTFLHYNHHRHYHHQFFLSVSVSALLLVIRVVLSV